MLVEQRRHWVEEKKRHGNRLSARLKVYFPQVLNWFDDIGAAPVLDLLARWPKLEQLQKAQRKTLETKLNAQLAEAEKAIAGTKSAAMANVRGIAVDAAGAIVERLVGTAPAAPAVAAAVDEALKR